MRPFTKIFGVGLSRTGTHSLTTALIRLGIPTIHFPQSFADIESHRGATDTPVAEQFTLLDRAFSGSLFVVTVRTVSEWLDSCARFWAANGQFAATPALAVFHSRLYGSATFDAALYESAYRRHMERVMTYFAHRPNSLLVMDICSGGDGWDKLAAFLDVPARSEPFPHERAPPAKLI